MLYKKEAIRIYFEIVFLYILHFIQQMLNEDLSAHVVTVSKACYLPWSINSFQLDGWKVESITLNVSSSSQNI